MPKAKHKHEYYLYLQQRGTNKDSYDLKQRCSICGKSRQVPFKMHLAKEGPYMKWLCRLEDFERVYGKLPIVEVI